MSKKVRFNNFYPSSKYLSNLETLFADYELFRQKHFSNLCIDLLRENYEAYELLLTHSATGALEMIALALDIQPGDEIILPSYTFVSTANAFALRGAKLVFVDIEMETLGIDPDLVEQAINDNTKAIVCMHYAGHACKIDKLLEIKHKYKLYLIEDAAMAYGSRHNGKALGTFGDFGVVSFDVTKHISATQGGLLIVNNSRYLPAIYQTYHIGTNRESFQNGNAPYYEWVSLGSKYQMPEVNAAILYAHLLEGAENLEKLRFLSKLYYDALTPLKDSRLLDFKEYLGIENYHEVFVLCKTKELRLVLQQYLSQQGIEALFHYIPLHSSKFGKQYAYFSYNDNTTHVADVLLRLPLHTGLNSEDVGYVCQHLTKFLQNG